MTYVLMIDGDSKLVLPPRFYASMYSDPGYLWDTEPTRARQFPTRAEAVDLLKTLRRVEKGRTSRRYDANAAHVAKMASS
jgi:hypothetical protein